MSVDTAATLGESASSYKWGLVRDDRLFSREVSINTGMATKAQLQAQLESCRNDNERLEELLRQRTAVSAADSPADSPGRREAERLRDNALQELQAAREENAKLLSEIRRLQQETEKAQQQLAVTIQQRDAANTELRRLQQQAETLERSEAPMEVERLRKRLAETQNAADVGARAAEEETRRLAGELVRQQQETELLQLRALAAQQQKWEAREQQMQDHLADIRRQLDQQIQRDRIDGEEWEARIHEIQGEAERAHQRGVELREQLETSDSLTRELTRELSESKQLYEALNHRLLSEQVPLAEAGHPATAEIDRQQPIRGRHSAINPAMLENQRYGRVEQRDPPPLVPDCTGRNTGGDVTAPSEAATEAQSDTAQQIVQVLSNLTHQLPTIPDFAGEDQTTEGSFLDWIERFEMVAELAQWSDTVKVKQLVLRLRNSAQAFYRTCSEEQKTSYQALVTEMSRRFTPVRIQALECSKFHERRQKREESVDAYAQDLQRLFKKAYPGAALGSNDALEMGQAVLSSQFVGGLAPEIKRKIAYIEGATFSELWQKARFEEARLQDLSNLQYRESESHRKSQSLYREDYPKREPKSKPLPPASLVPTSLQGGHTDQPKLIQQTIRCYKCNRLGHYARECRAQRQTVSEARGWQKKSYGARSAAVKPTSQKRQKDDHEEIFEWMYGESDDPESDEDTEGQDHPRLGPTLTVQLIVDDIPVNAVLDTGCPATIISRNLCQRIMGGGHCLSMAQLEERVNQQLSPPEVLLRAYCGNRLSIGAQVKVCISATGGQAVEAIVLVQKDAQFNMLLGTDLMGKLGLNITDAMGQALLVPEKQITPSPSHPLNSELDAKSLRNPKRQPIPRNSVGGKGRQVQRQRKATTTATVHLVQACRLPARSGKLLKVRCQQRKILGPYSMFKPKNKWHKDALAMADAILEPGNKHTLLPVQNVSGSPIWLRKGQILGHLHPVELVTQVNGHGLSSPEETDKLAWIKEVLPFAEKEESNAHSDPTIAKVMEDSSQQPASPKATIERLKKLKEELALHTVEAISPQDQTLLEDFLMSNHDLFALDNSELGRTEKIPHSIHTGDHPPMRQPARRIPFVLRSLVDDMIQEMLDNQVIQPSTSPWASPVVLVKKKDGSYRFCVDYRRLNAVTKKDAYPLPRIDDTLEALAGARYFTTLDLASGYWQVTLDPAAQEKTAFITHSGLYEFNVLPFGLCNAPATFQRLMETILAGLTRNQCFVYLDDILVISSSWEEHLTNLDLVFKRLRYAGLRLKPKKCAFARRKASYLGHVISESGIEVDPQKVDKVRNYPRPTNLKTLRQFLGLTSYYRRFVSQFSKVADPLYALTGKNVQFTWTPTCQDAFDKLKNSLTSTPVLAFPNFKQPFILETDASGVGLGAVLAQAQVDGTTRPIAYASRSLQKHERNYCVSELEALAVVWSVKHFHSYLYGHHCTVQTDHSALKSLLNTPNPSGKLARWGLALQELDLEICYRSGKSNANADALSRIPTFSDTEDPGAKEPPEACVMMLQSPTASPETNEGQYSQQGDEEIAAIAIYLETGSLPVEDKLARKIVLSAENFSLLDGTLYHTEPDGKLLITVPLAQRQPLLKEAHAGTFSGHLREAKVYSQLRKHYWWPNMHADVRRFCRACLPCATRHIGRATKAPLTPIPVAGPFDCVGVDVIQFPPTYDGNRYAIVFMDYLTKWPEVFAAPNQTAETIAQLLIEKIVCRHGVPAKLLSDRGANFLSELLEEIYRLLGTKKVNTSAYHPQTDGLVERFNRTLTEMLSKTVDASGRDWDRRLPYVLFAYRASIQESTKESPFFLLYGRDVRLPTEAMLNTPRTCYQVDLEDYKTDLVANFSEAWQLARQNVQQAQKKQKQYYDQKTKEPQYRVGDRVFVHMPGAVQGKAWKFSRPFYGPYRILELTHTNASVRPVDRPQESSIFVSLNRLRRCPRELPDVSWPGKGRRGRRKRPPEQQPPSPDQSPVSPTQGQWSTRLRPRRGRP